MNILNSVIGKVGSATLSGVKAGTKVGANIASGTVKAAAGGIKDAAIASSGPAGKIAEVAGKVAWETGKAAGGEAL